MQLASRRFESLHHTRNKPINKESQAESNSLQEILEAPGVIGDIVDLLVPVRPILVEHRAEDVVSRAQDKGVRRDPLIETPVAHQEDHVTAFLVLIKVVSSAGERARELVKLKIVHR